MEQQKPARRKRRGNRIHLTQELAEKIEKARQGQSLSFSEYTKYVIRLALEKWDGEKKG